MSGGESHAAAVGVLERSPAPVRRTVAPPSPAPQPSSKRLLMLLRRWHLYSGLLLLPWVLLYGISAFLFNHPGALAERTIEHVSPGALDRSGLAQLLDVERISRAVVAAANESPAASDEKFSLPSEARYDLSGRLSFERSDGVARGTLAVDLKTSTARVVIDLARSREATPVRAGWAADVRLDQPPSDGLRAAAALLLDEAGAPPGPLVMKASPKLAFDVLHGAERVRVSYDLQSNQLSTRSTEVAETSSSLREIFTQLHTTHGYQAKVGARTLWAFVVDAMALAMVSWAVTGIVMWWQLKRTRGLGAILLAGSFVAAVVVAVALHP